MLVDGTPFRTVWMDGATVHMIDQPRLPHSFQIAQLNHHTETANAITTMVVRGAGAIGATGAVSYTHLTLPTIYSV